MPDKFTLDRQLLNIRPHILTIFVLLILFSWENGVLAAPLADRLEQFPNWHSKPPVQLAKGDLKYPEWMAGTWDVTSTLVEKTAPLAPEIVSPGFEDNNDYLNQAIAFRVRFGKEFFIAPGGISSLFRGSTPAVVADRAFNGKQIAQAYLGDDYVYRVSTDPNNPNQQITLLRGERRLVSKITGRRTEIPGDREFIASEVTQQLFRSPERLYLNEVETTSDYHLLESDHIEAEQITAIYLSPQDPDYFSAGDRPVALYRYHLDLHPSLNSD